MCFPLLQAAVAFTFDSPFNHATGTVCASVVSSNGIQRLVHTLNYQLSTRQVSGLGAFEQSRNCTHPLRIRLILATRLCATLLFRPLCFAQVYRDLLLWLRTPTNRHEVWTRFAAQSGPGMGFVLSQLQGPEKTDQDCVRGSHAWFRTRSCR